MLVLALRPGLEDIVLKTSDGEIRLRPYWNDHGRMVLALGLPDCVEARREKVRVEELMDKDRCKALGHRWQFLDEPGGGYRCRVCGMYSQYPTSGPRTIRV